MKIFQEILLWFRDAYVGVFGILDSVLTRDIDEFPQLPENGKYRFPPHSQILCLTGYVDASEPLYVEDEAILNLATLVKTEEFLEADVEWKEVHIYIHFPSEDRIVIHEEE